MQYYLFRLSRIEVNKINKINFKFHEKTPGNKTITLRIHQAKLLLCLWLVAYLGGGGIGPWPLGLNVCSLAIDKN